MPLIPFIFILLASLVVPSLSRADARKDLQGIKSEIRQKKDLLNKTAKVESRVSTELNRIDQNIKSKDASIAALRRDLRTVETIIDKTQRDIEEVRKDAETRKALIQKRMVAAYKAGDTGTVRFLFSSQSLPQMQENLRYMKAVVDTDRKLIEAYNERVEKLRLLKRSLEGDARRKETLKGNIEVTKRQIEEEKVRKSTYLSKVREEKKTYQESLRELEANSKRLQAIVQKLEAASKKRYTAINKPRIRTQKKAGKTESRTENAVVPPINASTGFGAQKGRLSMPARGRIIDTFGRHKHPDFNSYTFSNGISIAAPSGTEVRSVFDGTVVFADYFKGYGNMVIVDHGDGFLSIYAHNSRIAKRTGAVVARNEVLANVGDVDSSKGSMLYFEIRYQGRAVDPSPWIR